MPADQNILIRCRTHKKPPRGEAVGVSMEPVNEIGAAGFEPTTPTTPKWCATKLRYAPARTKLSQRLPSSGLDSAQ